MNIEQSFFSEDELRVKIFKALADNVRLQIIRVLYQSDKELSCGEIGENLEITKSAASYHFKTLREAGLTITRKDGQTKYVQLNHQTFTKFLPHFLDTLLDERL